MWQLAWPILKSFSRESEVGAHLLQIGRLCCKLRRHIRTIVQQHAHFLIYSGVELPSLLFSYRYNQAPLTSLSPAASAPATSAATLPLRPAHVNQFGDHHVQITVTGHHVQVFIQLQAQHLAEFVPVKGVQDRGLNLLKLCLVEFHVALPIRLASFWEFIRVRCRTLELYQDALVGVKQPAKHITPAVLNLLLARLIGLLASGMRLPQAFQMVPHALR